MKTSRSSSGACFHRRRRRISSRLQQQLRGIDGHSDVRGLVVNGRAVENQTVKVDFNADPIPVMSGVITYYHR